MSDTSDINLELTWVEARDYAGQLLGQVGRAVGEGATLSDDAVSMMSDLYDWVISGGATGDERRKMREALERDARRAAAGS